MCKNSPTISTVEHYYNEGLNAVYLDPLNKTIGLSATSVSVVGSNLTCKFRRQNALSNSRYHDLNLQSLYVLMAFGAMSGESKKLQKYKVLLNNENLL